MNQRDAAKDTAMALLLVVTLAVAARLVVLPFATVDGSNATGRVWDGWNWLENPELITHGVWGPLHAYLVGLAMAVVEDPVWTPIVLHVALGAITPALVYIFTRNEFGSRQAALLVALTYALYPIAIRNSVSVRAEVPFVVFLLASMILVGSARRSGSAFHAMAAGVALTLAGALRYEGWMLIPFLGILLWRQPRLMILFGAFALIHPVFWMIGNAAYYGDPLYGVTAAADWELEAMGRSQLPFDPVALVWRASIFPKAVIKGVTLLIAGICAAGALIALVRRDRAAVWLIPLVGLTLLLSFAVARGTLVPKLNYTSSIGAMLFPFAAVAYRQIGIDRWPWQKRTGLACALLASMILFSCVACLDRIGLGRLAMSPVPTIENQAIALTLPPLIRDVMDNGDGFITDFYGWGPFAHVPLLARLREREVFMAPGAPGESVDLEALGAFVDARPQGALLVRSGSRFAEAIELSDDHALVGDRVLTLELVHQVAWPEDGAPDATLEIYRYRLEGDRRQPSLPGES